MAMSTGDGELTGSGLPSAPSTVTLPICTLVLPIGAWR
jgi:hypothetical protein